MLIKTRAYYSLGILIFSFLQGDPKVSLPDFPTAIFFYCFITKISANMYVCVHVCVKQRQREEKENV